MGFGIVRGWLELGRRGFGETESSFRRYTPSLGSGYSQFSHRHFLVGFGQKLFIYSQLTR